MRRILVLIVFPVVLLCSGWGFLVHRTVNQLAIYSLPKGMQAFFFTNKDSLVYNAPRPDVRRNTDKTEGSKHFMDMEYFGDSAFTKVPHDWLHAAEKFSADTLQKYGTLPYVVIENLNKLTEAFKSKNADSIVFYAADLGHYIGDAHVPLHTSINYDGQLTGQHGIHDLWETTVPEIEILNCKIKSCHRAKYLSDPVKQIWKIIEHTHSLLPQMFATEIEVSKNFTDSTKYRWQVRWGKNRRFYSSAFAKAYSKALKNSINDRLIKSAGALSDFWYTAWVNAGRPNLSGLTTKMYVKKDFKKEKKAYRHNRLMKERMLISTLKKTDD